VNVINSVNCSTGGTGTVANAAPAPGLSKADRLRELLQLFQQELISQEEYNTARAAILAS
jgi:hypothetical protein